MADTPVAPATPAAPAASAPAPAAPTPSSAPAPAAAPPASPETPASPGAETPAAPVPAATAPAEAASPAKYDPKTAAAQPQSSDYGQGAQGMEEFIRDNTEWLQAHPEEAERIRSERRAAVEDGRLIDPEAPAKPADATAEAIAAAEGEQPGEAKPPAEGVPASAATPAAIDAWVTKSPELKAVFEKYPELQAEIMETARGLESAKPVLDIVSTPEEAQFAVEGASRLTSLQTNWMLAGEDPEAVGAAWDMTVDFFKERDANGAEIAGADGRPKMAADYNPFRVKTSTSLIEDTLQAPVTGKIAALEAKLAGVYPNEEAKAADQALLDEAKYEKAAYDFVLDRIGKTQAGGAAQLPELPPNATPAQIAYQEQLKTERAELDAKAGKQTTETRKAARVALDREVQKSFDKGITDLIDTHINAMKDRGEFLPAFILTDKYINPNTGKVTNVSDIGARMWIALNAKINASPLHTAKLANLQAMGAAGKEARTAELNRLTRLYMPDLLQARITEIQNGIRESASGGKKPAEAVARPEPQSAGTVAPVAMDNAAIRTWAEAEAAKDPNWGSMDVKTREQLVMTKAAQKKYGATS